MKHWRIYIKKKGDTLVKLQAIEAIMQQPFFK